MKLGVGNPRHTLKGPGGYEGEQLRIAQNTNNGVPVYNPDPMPYREGVTEIKAQSCGPNWGMMFTI